MPRAFYDIAERATYRDRTDGWPDADGQAGGQGQSAAGGVNVQQSRHSSPLFEPTYLSRSLSPPLSDSSIPPIWGHPRDAGVSGVGGSEKCTNGLQRARRDARAPRKEEREKEKIKTRPEIAARRSLAPSTSQYKLGELFHSPTRAPAPVLSKTAQTIESVRSCLNKWAPAHNIRLHESGLWRG